MAGFTFGAPAPSTAATPAPAAGGFTFGAPVPAPAPNSSTATTATTGAASTFSFGAPATAPATTVPTTTTATPAAATTAPSAGTGFSFGGTTQPSTTTAAADATTATTSAFATPAAATNTPAPAATSAFGFGPSATTNANAVTTTAIATTATQTATATATVPTFEEPFPLLAVHNQIENLLISIHDHHVNANANNSNSHDETDLLLQGQELHHLLSLSATATATATTENNVTYGELLSNPVKALQSICQTNNEPTTNTDKLPNQTLRQQLQSKPMLQFPTTNSNNNTNSTTDTNITNIPPTMLNHIFKLSDNLQISEMDAASLFSVIQSTSQSNMSPLEEHIIGSHTVQWFKDRKMRPNLLQRGCFCIEDIVQQAKEDGTYVTARDSNSNGSANSTTQHNDMIGNRNGNGMNDDHILQLAMDLYFTERGSCLQTLLLLIQHRVSVYSSINDHIYSPDDEEGELPLATKIILQSTDQLLQSNLIPNLIAFIRKMTLKNEELGKKICVALDQQDRFYQQKQNQGQPQQQQQQPQPQQQQGGLLAFGAFGSANTPLTTSTATAAAHPNNNPLTQVLDVDYALYEFTFRQRQLAAECLFYLTYHTQCTPNEITSLIDVVQDLTNGDSYSNAKGIGSGLPSLDAIRDVPDPYVLSWGTDSDKSKLGGSTSNNISDDDHAMQGVTVGNTPLTAPQQRKLDKGRADWENELLSSLWSVRGLSNATITTMHTDYSGHRIYHATPLGAIASDVSISGTDASSSTGLGMNGMEGGASAAMVVGGGKPQLLQCVSTLILSVVCSLDAKNKLIDRNTHRPNNFGAGNALFPPQLSIRGPTEIHESIMGINERLDPNSKRYSMWKRQDIGGFFSGAYAFLLQPSTIVFTSPQKPIRETSGSSVGSSSSNAIYQTFRSCLETPTITKSLTFARVSLIASIGLPSMKSSSDILDNDFSFYISVLSDFTAQYLDAISSFSDLPISRAKWMDNEQQDLQVRHVQETQRREFNVWSGQHYQEIEIPTEVDIFQRPDCLDDIIALAVSVCSACPEGSNRFWSICEKVVEDNDGEPLMELKPSKILKKLDKLQVKDSSLLPVYLSFLGAIGLSESPHNQQNSMNGATAVHRWLSDTNRITSSPSSFGDERQISWDYILNAIRWYTQQLNPPEEENTNDSWRTSGSRYDQSDSEDVSGYYYGTENSGYNNTTQGGTNATSSTSGSAQNVKKELDEIASRTLMSLLSLLSRVTFKSEIARRSILEIRLAVPGSKRFIAVEDDALTILFSLLVTSISSELRGIALCAISNLVRVSDPKALSKEEQRKDKETIRRCWDLLELSQLVPIDRLRQYSTTDTNNSNNNFSGQLAKHEHNWFPPSEQNSIIYEMEYIECKNGSYPATEGLLKLLFVLFSSQNCPTDLGSGSRPMLGCNPYIEYVVDFVLPRAMGKKKSSDALYFTTPADKSRLLTRALEVVNAVLIRYMVPGCNEPAHKIEPSLVSEGASLIQGTKKTSINESKSESDFKMQQLAKESRPTSLSLVHSSIYTTHGEMRVIDTERDFTDAVPQTNAIAGSQVNPIPQAKSPGFYILADLLSSDGSLLGILSQILMQDHSVESIGNLSGNSSRSSTHTKALFGEVVPQYLTAKAARDYLLDQQKQGLKEVRISSIRPQYIENLMLPLYPQNIQEVPATSLTHAASTTVTDCDDIIWKEHCALLALRIMCAAAGRDRSFRSRIDISKAATRIIPVLRFYPRNTRSIGPLLVKNAQVTGISKLILQKQSILPSLVQYIGYQPSSLTNDNSLAAAAISIVKFLSENVPSREFSRCISGMSKRERMNIAVSFATRLSLASLAKEEDDGLEISEMILKQLSSDFSHDTFNNENLSHTILGLSSKSLIEKKEYLLQSFQGIDVELCEFNNILDAMIGLISDLNFVLEPKLSPLASKCFEIIYRLCDNETPSFQLTKFCIMSKLQRMGFWQTQMLRFVGKPEGSDSLLNMILTKSPIQGDCGLEESIVIKRDSDIMHCVSWVLKGVALELHTLMGYGIDGGIRHDIDVSILTAMSPRPTKCRQVLRLLFGDPTSILSSTLNCLPIKKPLMAKKLFANAPHRDIVGSASCMMKGPMDICSGYQVIDSDILLTRINEYYRNREVVEIEKEKAFAWARNWNSYVNFSCASSHLCQSWYFLSHSALTFFKSLNEGTVLDTRFVMEILNLILFRLNSHGKSSTIDGNNGNNSIVVYEKEEFEATSIYPLSALCATLVELILVDDEAIGEDAIQKLVSLLIGAIASCETSVGMDDVSNNERAAELCCALTALLESDHAKDSNWYIGSSSLQFRNETLKTASYLSKLSVLPTMETEHQDNNSVQYVSQVARSSLASLLSWSDRQEIWNNSAGQGHFLVELFAPDDGIVANPQPRDKVLQQYIELLGRFDETIVDLLEHIACCTRGTELLVNHGLSQALISISQTFFGNINANHAASTYGSVGIEVPDFLCCHFSLFNSMLSSKAPRTVSLQLIADAVSFLQIHSQNSERILSGYPKNNQLILNLVTTLCRISSSVGDGKDLNIDMTFRSSDWFINLEYNVTNLAFHLALYPLPPKFLTRLPNELKEAQFALAKGNHQRTHSQLDNCWWDAIESLDKDDIIVLDPVMKSFGGTTLQADIGDWSISKYECACSAAQYLDLCLLYITNKLKESSVIDIDILPIASAICRCSDTIYSVANRLTNLKADGEKQLSNMFSNLMDTDHDFARVNMLDSIERKILETYHNTLSACLEKLLYIAKEKIQIQLQTDRTALHESVSLLSAAINHTGVASQNGDIISFSGAMANELIAKITEICNGR